jgi:hypothetical protein
MSTRTLLAVVLFVVFVACSAFAQYPAPPPGVNPQRDVRLTAPSTASQQPPDLALLAKLRVDDGAAAAWWQVRLTAAYVFVTGLLFLVALGQLVAIARQAKSMGEALKLTQAQVQLATDGLAVAKQSADAATKSAAATERMVYLSLRARIDRAGVELIGLQAGHRPRAKLVLENTGGKPAHVDAYCSVFRVTDQPWDPEPVYPPDTAWASTGNAAVGKSGDLVFWSPSLDHDLSAEEFDRIESGQVKVRVYGAVRYNDGFGKTRTTGFGLEYSPELTRSSPANEQSFCFPPSGNYNHAD